MGSSPVGTGSVQQRYAVDICAGTCSALRFHLEQDPKAKVLAIDILPYHTVVAHIPTHLRARFSYCQMDIRELDISRLQKVLYDTWSIPIDGVDHWHASIPCQTYSVAHHNNNFHRDGLTPITDKARTHDAILEHTMSLVQTIATHNPHTFISLENPLGLWKYMPAVQSCAQLPNWLLLDAVHYCANTSEKDGAFPKKPTSFLFFNVPDTFRLATCNNDCPHRISESSPLHAKVLCRHTYTHAQQQVITDVAEKGKIPLKIFEQAWRAHMERRQTIHNPRPSTSPASNIPSRNTVQQRSHDSVARGPFYKI